MILLSVHCNQLKHQLQQGDHIMREGPGMLKTFSWNGLNFKCLLTFDWNAELEWIYRNAELLGLISSLHCPCGLWSLPTVARTGVSGLCLQRCHLTWIPFLSLISNQ